MYRPNLKSVASPVPEIIATGVLGLWVGVRDGTVRKRPSMKSFPLSYAFQTLSFLCSSTPLFPMFPESRLMAFGLRRAKVLG